MRGGHAQVHDAVLHVAIVGGARFDEAKLEDFIFKLAEKHPDAVIFTGSGKGSEKRVIALGEGLGLKVRKAQLYEQWYGEDALICQVNSILVASGLMSPLVLVGTGARVTRAKEIRKRLSPYEKEPRLVHEIAKVPTVEREPAPRKAKKPRYD